MRNRINLILFALILLLATCGEDDNATRPYPRVRTKSVTNITSEGAFFEGEITFSSVKIVDHGFVWSTDSNPTLENSDDISLGQRSGIGKFTSQIEWSLEEGKKYYVKAYAKSDDYTVYGDVAEFVSLGSKGPRLISVIPEIGTWKDTVVITGENFSEILKSNAVSFDTLSSRIIRNTKDSIICIVPQLLMKDISNVSVSVVGNVGTLEKAFSLTPPVINMAEPLIGSVNAIVTITGEFFSIDHTKVFFSDIEAVVSEVLSNKIVCKVPAGLQEGNVVLKVVTGLGNLKAETGFTSKKPKISDISPLQGTYYDIVTVAGESFPTNAGFVKIKFGNKYVSINSITSTALTFQIPSDLETPSHQIVFEYGSEKIIYDKLFTLSPPEIIDIDPVKTFFYNTITITGKNFSPIKNTVIVGDQSIEVSSNSTEKIEIFIPNTITAHENVLKVGSSGQTAIANQKVISRWMQIGSFFYDPNYLIAPISIGDGVFLLTVNSSDNTSGLYKYNENPRSWTKETTTPFIADFAQSCFYFSIGSKAYFGSGITAQTDEGPTYSKDLWEYDAATKEWTQKNLAPKEILYASGFSANGKGYFLAGTTPEGQYSYEVWEYDPQNDSWVQKADYPEAVYGAILVGAFNNQFFILNGNNELMKYDFNLNGWTQVKTFDDGQFLFAINNRIYFSNPGLLKIYDIPDRTWTETNEFFSDWQSLIGISSNNKGFLFSNYSWNNSYFVWEFDPNF
jgi:hypothetical protein